MQTTAMAHGGGERAVRLQGSAFGPLSDAFAMRCPSLTKDTPLPGQHGPSSGTIRSRRRSATLLSACARATLCPLLTWVLLLPGAEQEDEEESAPPHPRPEALDFTELDDINSELDEELSSLMSKLGQVKGEFAELNEQVCAPY